MGGSSSRRQSPALPPAPAGSYGADNSFIPGGRGAPAAGFGPNESNALTLTSGSNANIISDMYQLREVPETELQDPSWARMKNAIPIYVAIPKFGVSSTERYRLVGNTFYYAVHKLHPLSPENDIQFQRYYEVPFKVGNTQVIFALKYAISEYWPSKNTVVFITNRGTTFALRNNELLDIRNQEINIAIQALKNDYPKELDPVLSYRQVETPQFDTYQPSPGAATSAYTTLTPSKNRDRLYNALSLQRRCAQKHRTKPPIPTVTVVTGACPELKNGVPSSRPGRGVGFDNLDGLRGDDDAVDDDFEGVGDANSSETPTSGTSLRSSPLTSAKNIQSDIMSYQNNLLNENCTDEHKIAGTIMLNGTEHSFYEFVY